MAIPRRHSMLTTFVGSLLLCGLLGLLYVYDQVPLQSGPSWLIGLPAGSPCEDSEQCRAPLGSATRLATPKACEATPSGGRCRLVCDDGRSCPTGQACHAGRYVLEGSTFDTRVCDAR